MKHFQKSELLGQLPTQFFASLVQKVGRVVAEGHDVINLGQGNPDQPTPEHIVRSLQKAVDNPIHHKYSPFRGNDFFKEAIAEFYKREYNVTLDPKTEVAVLFGGKAGLVEIPQCLLNEGDTVLVPDPGYPDYWSGVALAKAKMEYMPLEEVYHFLPNYEAIDESVLDKAKLMFLNYPNNPTGAIAEEGFFRDVVAFAKKYNVLVCHDAPYSEMTFDGYRPLSFLQVPGAREVGIEFHSLSKPYNMTGWRIGWAAGNREVIESLGRLKSNIDSGVFQAIQYAAIAGLTGPQESVAGMCRIYQERRDILVDGLNKLGWNLEKPRATFYLWAPVPAGYTSESFSELVLEKAGVVITPGTGYGAKGAGYFRMALTVEKERIVEALERINQNIGRVKF